MDADARHALVLVEPAVADENPVVVVQLAVLASARTKEPGQVSEEGEEEGVAEITLSVERARELEEAEEIIMP